MSNLLRGAALCLVLPLLTARAGLQTDLEYGIAAGESLKLDAYLPEGAGPFPAVILVHGGGWNSGDKSGGPKKGYMAPLHEPLQKAGYAWFSINYRLAPKHPYPANVEDVETAIRWIKSNAARFQIDPQRIALSGESAGGQLVALAAVRAMDATRVAAVVPFYAPFDLIGNLRTGDELRPGLADLFGRKHFDETTQKIMREASPLFQLTPGLPPFLLVHGTADQSVAFQQSLNWQSRMKAVGMTCDLITVKDGRHGMLYWDDIAPSYKSDVIAWLDRVLKTKAANAAR